MKVDTIRTNWADTELAQNTHIITIGEKCIIVDAGAKLQEVLEIVGNKKVEAILITHAHFDHISCIDAYEIAFGCPIYLHEKSERFLTDPELNVSKYFVQDITFEVENLHYLKGKETLNIAGVSVRAIYTPGHSEDSMCYLVCDTNNNCQDDVGEDCILFTGDTLFARAVGRTDLSTGNPKTLIASLNHILKFKFNNVYTGHLRATTKQEQLTNVPTWINYIKRNILNIKSKEQNLKS